jgi:hypothetical protein
MEIVPIFVGKDLEQQGGLFAFRWALGRKDVFEELLDFWFDTEQVYDWLKGQIDFDFAFYKLKSIEDGVLQVMEQADEILSVFERMNEKGFKNEIPNLQSVFKP